MGPNTGNYSVQLYSEMSRLSTDFHKNFLSMLISELGLCQYVLVNARM